MFSTLHQLLPDFAAADAFSPAAAHLINSPHCTPVVTAEYNFTALCFH
jgi:hypothetical protein